MSITIKDWNNLTDSQRNDAVEFALSDSIPAVKKMAASKYIAVKEKLNAWQKIMLSVVTKHKDGKVIVKLEKEI